MSWGIWLFKILLQERKLNVDEPALYLSDGRGTAGAALGENLDSFTKGADPVSPTWLGCRPRLSPNFRANHHPVNPGAGPANPTLLQGVSVRLSSAGLWTHVVFAPESVFLAAVSPVPGLWWDDLFFPLPSAPHHTAHPLRAVSPSFWNFSVFPWSREPQLFP